MSKYKNYKFKNFKILVFTELCKVDLELELESREIYST